MRDGNGTTRVRLGNSRASVRKVTSPSKMRGRSEATPPSSLVRRLRHGGAMPRSHLLHLSLAALLCSVTFACSGGAPAGGGSGGASASGGVSGSGGTGSGGNASGGAPGSGGTASGGAGSGGAMGTGGHPSGGATASGGTGSGGLAATGGHPSGGSGGSGHGGATGSGGQASSGGATGSGGAASGGSTASGGHGGQPGSGGHLGTGGGQAGGHGGGSGGTGAGGSAASFSDVLAIFEARCVNCHDATKQGLPAYPALSLTSGDAYSSLVGHPADETCGGVRVVAGDPASSYLIHKVSDATPCDGARMPAKYEALPAPPLTSDEIATLTSWIAAGAPR